MELIERIKAECKKHEDSCLGCLLHTENGCYCADYVPFGWDIEAIRKALDETSDKASDEEEIVVPKKITTGYATKANPDVNARMINEIIECLEQIAGRLK